MNKLLTSIETTISIHTYKETVKNLNLYFYVPDDNFHLFIYSQLYGTNVLVINYYLEIKFDKSESKKSIMSWIN